MYIIHELEAEKLSVTVAWFANVILSEAKDLYACAEGSLRRFAANDDVVRLVHLSQLDSIPAGATTLILHLALDNEIPTHKLISARLSSCNQLNPYDLLAEIADDKYSFYNHMLAAEIPQPETAKLDAGDYDDAYISGFILKFMNSFAGVVLKPNHGTEKLDFFMLTDMELLDLALQHARKILSYDDLIIQRYIETDNEYRVLYLLGSYYSVQQIDMSYLPQIQAIVKALPQEPKILAFDILDDNGVLIPLEMNIRPAAMHRCAYVN